MTSGELEAYDARVVEQQRAAYEFVEKGLRDFIALNGADDVALLRDYAIALLEQAQANYGDAAAKVACDAYDEVVAALGVEADPAEMADAGDYDPEGFARYQAGKVAAGDIEGFIAAVAAEAEYRARLAANLTTSHNAERDHGKGVRFARVPTGRATCGFCVVMASLGFSYTSREAAGDVGARFNSYHRHCDCRVVAGVEGTTIDGYDPEWYKKVYYDARDTVSGDARRRWDALSYEEKKDKGPYSDFLYDRVFAEINTRSPDWVYRRKEPETTFETPELEEMIRKEHPHELATAARLKAHGMKTDFQVDEEIYIDEKTGRTQVRGLPDLANGYELKTLSGSASRNTINSHLKNASKKKGTVAVVFDNSDNPDLEDRELIEIIQGLRSFSRGRVYVIGKDGSYTLAR